MPQATRTDHDSIDGRAGPVWVSCLLAGSRRRLALAADRHETDLVNFILVTGMPQAIFIDANFECGDVATGRTRPVDARVDRRVERLPGFDPIK